jgi:hypothetical protein
MNVSKRGSIAIGGRKLISSNSLLGAPAPASNTAEGGGADAH